MVTKVISHIDKIKAIVDEELDFVVNGGAGSGKTYTLIETLKHVLINKPASQIACITYTNVAVNEIRDRFPHENLWVSTIHEFVWDIVKNYKNDIIDAIINLVIANKIRYSGDVEITKDKYKPKTILYGEYQNLEDGVISHNAVLEIGLYLFQTHNLLSTILQDRYDYIFVDEYQDTDKKIISLLMDEFRANSSKSTIGFFGDPMQSIYGTGIGNLRYYIDETKQLKEVIIDGNRRCSESVISLLNKLRTDIKQIPANNNLKGNIKLLWSSNEVTIEKVKENSVFDEWNFSDTESTRELYLTHRLIASKQKFDDLLQVYRDLYGGTRAVEKLMGDSRDALAKHLHKIEELIYLYTSGNHNEFIDQIDCNINYHKDKIKLYNQMMRFNAVDNKSIGDIINYAEEIEIVKANDNLVNLKVNNEEFYSNVLSLNYLNLKNMYTYSNNFSPYSTQHGVKGSEYNDVFVVLDNGGWNSYNFEQLLGIKNRESVYERTLKILYVCCSRAKRNLVVYCPNFKPSMLKKSEEWFDKDNVIKL